MQGLITGQTMEPKERIHLLEENLSRILGLISSADSKAGTILAIDTAMLGSIAVLIPSPALWTSSLLCISITPTLLLLLSLFSLSLATFPRIKGPRNSIIYFGAISQKTLEDYKEEVLALLDENYIGDLLEQCHRNSEIAKQKYLWIRRSMILLYASTPFWLLALYSFYQLRG